ncbi:hypothetical protein BF49_1110 [Bradyrhizobium sp.]|nr:hypothetical protein BF49_1110 [Bradyrhizobium sp.]
MKSRVQINHPFNGREFLPHGVHVVVTRHTHLLLSAPSDLAVGHATKRHFETARPRCTSSSQSPTAPRI